MLLTFEIYSEPRLLLWHSRGTYYAWLLLHSERTLVAVDGRGPSHSLIPTNSSLLSQLHLQMVTTRYFVFLLVHHSVQS